MLELMKSVCSVSVTAFTARLRDSPARIQKGELGLEVS